MVLPGEIDVDYYILELESTIIKLTDENEALRGEIDSLKKKLLLYEKPHTPPSRQMITPKITNSPGKRCAHRGHKGATRVLGEPDEIIHVTAEKFPNCISLFEAVMCRGPDIYIAHPVNSGRLFAFNPKYIPVCHY